jgi:hypothetical protein
MPAELGRTTGPDGIDELLLGGRERMGLPVGVAIQAEDVGDFPRGPGSSWLAVPSMGAAPSGRHGLPPW